MAILKIVSVPDEVLRKRTQKVVEFDKKFQQFVEDMVDTLRDAPGVGLAAPQVGVSKKLIIVEYGDDEDESVPKKLYVVATKWVMVPASSFIGEMGRNGNGHRSLFICTEPDWRC